MTKISETKDLSFVRQDGKITDLMSLKGKVLLVQSLPQSQPDAVTTAVMKRLKEKYSGNEDFVLVTLVLDPGPAEGLQEQLKAVSTMLSAELPQWTVGSNEKETLHKFIKNEFKANRLPYAEDGKWVYDKSLVLIDKNRHVRRAVVPQQRGGASYVAPFDFELAAEWDEKGVKTGTELTNVEQLEVLLMDTIEILLSEKVKP
jgi:cytochrome oxidase Cu insertion factor (SCO1/SenC/PrrC family)